LIAWAAQTMDEIRLHNSIRDIGRDAWNDCFATNLEGYDYLLATEEAGIHGFEWRYLAAYKNDRAIATIPAFLTDYHLDTTLPRGGKKVTDAIQKLFPGLLTLKLASIGSPLTEYGQIGFHPSVDAHERPMLLTHMLHHFEQVVEPMGYRLLGLKDIPAHDESLWNEAALPLGYKSVNGLPSAYLDIDFATVDEYFATKLSHATRKDMRRKLRSQDKIRVEYRETIDDVLPRVMELYADTHDRADMQFEELTPAFFKNFLNVGKENALCMLYWAGTELLAANFLLRDGTTLLDKFFVMDSGTGRAHHLYFISWFTNVDYCLKHGLTRFQSGQAAYANKLRLGSKLVTTRMMFRHKNPILNSVLRLASPILEADDPMTLKEAA